MPTQFARKTSWYLYGKLGHCTAGITHSPLTDETVFAPLSTSAKPDQLNESTELVPSLAAAGEGLVLRTIGRCDDMYLINASRALATVAASGCLESGASERTSPYASTLPITIASSATREILILRNSSIYYSPEIKLLGYEQTRSGESRAGRRNCTPE